MRKPVGILVAAFIGCTFCSSSGQAFVRETYNGVPVFWLNAQTTVSLQLGCPASALPYWGPCWDNADADAMNYWNTAGAQFRFIVQSPAVSADPCGAPDGVHTVSFRSTNCGFGFGGALALTYYIANEATGEFVDTDTIFDAQRAWTTYPGPLRSDNFGNTIYDFHRVAIHELGHMLGLDHPDDFGQIVAAIMNSHVSNIDTLQADDIAGIQAIYPATAPTPRGVLANPRPGSPVSGINTVSGWVCNVSRVDLQVDGTITVQASYGTSRTDTRPECGDDNNGFGLLVNWNNLSDGTHEIVALADGVEFARATFTVTTLGTQFLQGASGRFTVPFNNRNVTIEWVESLQNFVIAGVQ
jgi:hypothetical protein